MIAPEQQAPSLDGYPLRFDGVLVEKAVLGRMRELSLHLQAPFHRDREPIYEISDLDEREAAFRRVHGRYFEQLGLGAPFQRALIERPSVVSGTGRCHILPATSRTEEYADLLVSRARPGGESAPTRTLAVRVRPEALLHPASLLRFLRPELLHIADMLDPDFGYHKDLPPTELGPSFENLLRDRYRILWRTTVDGRLYREGFSTEETKGARRREFARTFRMLGDRLDEGFRVWFERPRPRHAAMIAFARNPRCDGGVKPGGWTGFCPVCRLPTAEPAPGSDRLPAEVARRIREAHPGWRTEQGVCFQCAYLYEVRTGVQAGSDERRPTGPDAVHPAVE